MNQINTTGRHRYLWHSRTDFSYCETLLTVDLPIICSAKEMLFPRQSRHCWKRCPSLVLNMMLLKDHDKFIPYLAKEVLNVFKKQI